MKSVTMQKKKKNLDSTKVGLIFFIHIVRKENQAYFPDLFRPWICVWQPHHLHFTVCYW